MPGCYYILSDDDQRYSQAVASCDCIQKDNNHRDAVIAQISSNANFCSAPEGELGFF